VSISLALTKMVADDPASAKGWRKRSEVSADMLTNATAERPQT
jgi:hypothetical protein